VALMRMLRLIKRSLPATIEPAQHYLLHMVCSAGRVRLSELAAQVQLDLSTVSRHARALEAAGYLERTADPADRRSVVLSLTDAGRKVLDDTFARRRAILDAALQDWSADDVGTLRQLLDRLASGLERQALGATEPRHVTTGGDT